MKHLWILAVLLTSLAHAGTVSVGDVLVGICDSIEMDTQMGALEVFSSTGMGVAEFDANPHENICIGQMAVDAQGNTYALGDNGTIYEYDANGQKIRSIQQALIQFGSHRAMVLTTITHDQAGNLFYSNGDYLIETQGPAGDKTLPLAETGLRFAFFSDQHTIAYVGQSSGNVHSYDVLTQSEGPLLLSNGTTRDVVVLPDSSLLILDSAGNVSLWTTSCWGCAYQLTKTYNLPSTVENIAPDPNGSSFRAIHTWYDDTNELGDGSVYQVTVSNGALTGTIDISGLHYGRYYSSSLAVYGDGMNTQAQALKLVKFGKAMPIGGSRLRSIAIKNVGQVEMTIAAVGVLADDGDGTEFEIIKNQCQKGVRPGTHCNITVQYKATRSGQQTGELLVYANLQSGQKINLLGVGQ